jgi:hypothetical protein
MIFLRELPPSLCALPEGSVFKTKAPCLKGTVPARLWGRSQQVSRVRVFRLAYKKMCKRCFQQVLPAVRRYVIPTFKIHRIVRGEVSQVRFLKPLLHHLSHTSFGCFCYQTSIVDRLVDLLKCFPTGAETLSTCTILLFRGKLRNEVVEHSWPHQMQAGQNG